MILNKKTIYTSILLLGLISITNLFLVKSLSNLYNLYYIKQLIWFIIGFIILFNKKKLNINTNYLYLISILFLIYVLMFSSSVNGAKAWIDFKLFSFQPSELTKISLILTLNKLLNKNYNKIKKLIIGTLTTIIPSILVFLEPDTGAIIFFLIIYICFLLKLKLNIIYYLTFIFMVLSSIILFIYFYKYNSNIFIKIFGVSSFYRIDRILNYKNNYQLNLSLISIYSSGIIKNGFNNKVFYIPEAPTDFIFSYIVGNFGLIIIPIILFLYLLIIESILIKKTNFLSISFLSIFIFQLFINISMNIGLIPIIGIPLPFLSYGGSNTIMYFILLKLFI